MEYGNWAVYDFYAAISLAAIEDPAISESPTHWAPPIHQSSSHHPPPTTHSTY